MKRHSNEFGMSLIEVLVSSSIALIASLAMATLISSQQKQLKSLEQKLESIELESSIQRVVAETSSCQCMFQGVSFDQLDQDGSVTLPALHHGCVTGNDLVTQNTPLAGTKTGLRVSTIQLVNQVGSSSQVLSCICDG